MTSAAEPVPVLWITGLAGCGKSTLAAAVAGRLRAQGWRPLLLDGDGLTRCLETPPLSYEAGLRRERAWRMARLASMAAWQGVPAVVATVSLLHEVQDWNRANAPALVEVLIEAPADQLQARRPHLYGTQQSAAASHVVGIDIAAEFPQRPDLVVQQDYDTASLQRHALRCAALWQDAAGAARKRA